VADAFDPPSGDPAALAAAATRFGTVSSQVKTDSGQATKAIETARAHWKGARADDFVTASFGVQSEIDVLTSVTGVVSGLLSAYARQWDSTLSTLADLRQRHDTIARQADTQAKALGDDSSQADMIYLHAARRQGPLVGQALEVKSRLTQLAGRLAAAVDAETDQVVPGGSKLSPEEIRRKVDSSYGVTGLIGAAATNTLTAAQAWALLAPARERAGKILDIMIDNADGEQAGGPVTTLPDDPALLRLWLDDARADGLPPSRYRALLAQFWAADAARRAGIDLHGWDPKAGTDKNQKTISAVYTFYGSLFLTDPDLTWAGMANMIGPSFAAGFMDIDTFRKLAGSVGNQVDKLPSWLKPLLPPEVLAAGGLSDISESQFQYFEQKFLAMQKHIFFDQASMHAAYTTTGPYGGMDAINEMYDAGLIDAKARGAWVKIDSGVPQAVASGNTDLLDREQNQIIAKQYDDMRNHDGPVGQGFTYLMTAVGSASIPGTKTPAQFDPFSLSDSVQPGPGQPVQVKFTLDTPLPAFNISDQDARWNYVTKDTLPAYQKLLATDPDRARQIVSTPVDQRIDEQRLLQRWPHLAGQFATDWDLHTTVQTPHSVTDYLEHYLW
jgi:hypothetical protein